MGRSQCCVGGCNNAPGDGVSLHTFPKDDFTRRMWVKAIQMTGTECSRVGWAGPRNGTSANAQLVCSQHFELSMFTSTTRTHWKLGLPYRPKLNDGAKPTLFGENVRRSNLEDDIQSRPVVRKREVQRILKDYNQQLIENESPSVVPEILEVEPAMHNADTSISPSVPSDPIESEKTIVVSQSKEIQTALETGSNDTYSTPQKLTKEISGKKVQHIAMTGNKKQADKCHCEKCCVTTSIKGVQVNQKPPANKRKTRGTQTLMNHHTIYTSTSTQYCVSDVAVQGNIVCADMPVDPISSSTPASTPSKKKLMNESFMSTSSWGMMDNKNVDPDYEPEASFISEPEYDDRKPSNVREQRKFLVFEDNLLDLFAQCEMCHHPTEGRISTIKGTYVAISQTCDCGHSRKWESQPKINQVPAGNILLSAAILFSGCSPTKVLRIFSFINALCISLSTFFMHQRTVLWPAIERVWTKTNGTLISSLLERQKELVVAGDGRADSPGHSAKFGVYSMIDMDTGKVIALELVQSNEVKSSYHMELEGLRRVCDRLHGHGLSIGEIITDRHVQIQKWIRETLPGTVHSFDVWHIGKAVKKKVLALSKLKDCASVAKWMKSITNHLYWAASSSRSEDGSMVEAKWMSVINHVQNIHTGHGILYDTCEHGPLEDRDWLKTGSKAAVMLEDILLNKRLCTDISKISTGFQTSTLEAFHSVINQFAPKMCSFSYHGQMCRQYLAALHFNENVKREKRVGLNGKFHIKVVFPKYKTNDEFSVRYVKDEMTFDYAQDLINMTIAICGEINTISTPAPPPLTSGKRKPSKVEITKCLATMCKKLRY